MKHVNRLTIRKACEDEDTWEEIPGFSADEISALLDQVFGNIQTLVASKGKGGQNGAS